MSWDWSKDKLDGSDERLRAIFCENDGGEITLAERFSLPKRNDHDYAERLKELFHNYTESIHSARKVLLKRDHDFVSKQVGELAQNILLALDLYHDGFPSDAYSRFEGAMNGLVKDLKKYFKNGSSAGFLTTGQGGLRLPRSTSFACAQFQIRKSTSPRISFMCQ